MAIFSNQATLTLDGVSVDSNIAYGEIIQVLTITKTALGGTYTPGDTVTYVVALRNTGSAALNGITVTDDLGGYELDGQTVYPLSYEDGSLALFVNGVMQSTPAVESGPPLVIGGINLAAGADAVIVYRAVANNAAPPAQGSQITNTATATGAGLAQGISDSETVEVLTAPSLAITKTITPAQVSDNSRVSYTFVISNTGNEAVTTDDDAVITDLFDPILTDLTVTFNGEVWSEGEQYNYNASTGLFTTIAGNISVPAASFAQNPATGEYTITPGIATLVVTGII